MNKKDVGEIRRRFNPERSNISHIYGCYVNCEKEIISYIDESMGLLQKEESEKYLTLLKKTLSGTLGRNLTDISFATKQVMDSDEHRLLTALRKSALQDEEARNAFFKTVIDALDMDGENYLILMAHDAYDVPHRGKDGSFHEEESTDTFRYIICCICPVKTGKAGLGYDADESRFHSRAAIQLVSPPELGFMFPAFDERAANIYGALFYSRNTASVHSEFVDAVFKTPSPMAPAVQKETFGSVLTDSLGEECSFDVIRSVHSQLADRIEIHKESKDPEALTLTVDDMGDILESGGMDSDRIDKFRDKCEKEFGRGAVLRPGNIIEAKKLSIETPEVKIKVETQYSELIRTQIIDGRKYILIPADSGVEVNGIQVSISE